jgi:hypothetical protein
MRRSQPRQPKRSSLQYRELLKHTVDHRIEIQYGKCPIYHGSQSWAWMENLESLLFLPFSHGVFWRFNEDVHEKYRDRFAYVSSEGVCWIVTVKLSYTCIRWECYRRYVGSLCSHPMSFTDLLHSQHYIIRTSPTGRPATLQDWSCLHNPSKAYIYPFLYLSMFKQTSSFHTRESHTESIKLQYFDHYMPSISDN